MLNQNRLPVLSLLLTIIIINVNSKNLYVATGGNDSTSYEENAITSPWATPHRAWLYAQTGDTVLFRGGTYNVTETINTKYIASNGTSESPIVFTNYNNENVIISGDVGGGPIFIIEKSYNYIHNLTLRGGNFGGGGLEGSVIVVGWDLNANNFKITNSTIEIYQSNTYSNNASIRLNFALSNFAEISNCNIIGDGGTIGIQMFRTQGVKIYNNEFSNCGVGVYMKHSNALDTTTLLTNIVENNVFSNLSREGLYGNFNYGILRNNLLIDCGISFGDDGGMGDGYVGADYNSITHNTLINSGIEFQYESREEDPNKGCLHNTIENNIIMNRCIWHNYDSIDADIRTDYNLYPDLENLMAENRINYNLAQWQIKNGTDSNSLLGDPIFIGNNSFSTWTDYALTDLSPGKNAASDGTDIGINATNIGIQNISTPISDKNKSINNRILNNYFTIINNSKSFLLNIKRKGNYKITVYSLNGKTIEMLSLNSANVGTYSLKDNINVPMLQGFYLLNITVDGYSFRERALLY